MSDHDDFPRRVGEADAYMLGWRPKEELMDQRISSSWESARGEMEPEWTWTETLVWWSYCVTVAISLALVTAMLLGWVD